jgi:hypothetical protein
MSAQERTTVDLVALRADIEDCPDCTIQGFELCSFHSKQLPVVGEGRVEQIKEAIHTTDRLVSTLNDLAKDLDVTNTTIANYLDEVLLDPTVNSRVVGKTRILWPYRDKEGNTSQGQYIPSEAYKRALEKEQSLGDYLRDLVLVESALEDAGFEKTNGDKDE